MSLENAISIEIPENDVKKAQDALKTLTDILNPYLVALTSEQRKTLPKMGDGTEPFVAKVMDYTDSSPQFTPPYVDKNEMQKDWAAVNDLLPLFRGISQLDSNLNDTVMLAGSEAYVASLSYYNSVKQAAKVNVPDAKVIYEDLRQRFERSSSTSNSDVN